MDQSRSVLPAPVVRRFCTCASSTFHLNWSEVFRQARTTGGPLLEVSKSSSLGLLVLERIGVDQALTDCARKRQHQLSSVCSKMVSVRFAHMFIVHGHHFAHCLLSCRGRNNQRRGRTGRERIDTKAKRISSKYYASNLICLFL